MRCESVQFCHLRRETTRYLSASLVFALLLLLSNLRLLAHSIPEIVATTKPAVVEIVTRDATGTPKTLGTGFFVSSDGLVVTNQHVVEGATSIAAINNNGAFFQFERVVAQPTGVDLAILKFRAIDVPFLPLGNSTTAVEGQKVIVIGNPTGLTGTVSDGIISAFRENRSLIQITAPISHGSSGSPVMDETGQVIGIATLIKEEGQNLNFAIVVEKMSAALTQQLPREQSSNPALPPATPTPAIDAMARGTKSFNRGDYDKAISDSTEAIRLDPNSADAYYLRGNAYENQRNFDRAISDYNEAIRLDPKYTFWATFCRGNAYYGKGNLDMAISDYNEAILLDPNNAQAYVGRGTVYSDHNNLDKAISDYNEAIRIDPNYAPCRLICLSFLQAC
jgi:Flp pilus assembly protein TadD